MTLRIEIITDAARFAAIQQAWRQLWERSGGFVFQRHDWITGWISGMRDRRDIKLQIAVAWEGDQLCGAMPCAVHRRSGLRVMSWAAQLFSDYCDCLVDPAYDNTDVLPLLWDGLARIGGFDLINLQQVRARRQVPGIPGPACQRRRTVASRGPERPMHAHRQSLAGRQIYVL